RSRPAVRASPALRSSFDRGLFEGEPTTMTLLDPLLVVAVVVAGWAGYRRGAGGWVVALGWLVGGAPIGGSAALALLGDERSPQLRAGLLLVLTLAFALIMQFVGAVVGMKLRARLGPDTQRADARAGAVLLAAIMLIVAWMGGTTLLPADESGG